MSNNRIQLYENNALDSYVPIANGYIPSWGGGQTNNSWYYQIAWQSLKEEERELLVASLNLTSKQMAASFSKRPAAVRKQIERLKTKTHVVAARLKRIVK